MGYTVTGKGMGKVTKERRDKLTAELAKQVDSACSRSDFSLVIPSSFAQ